MSLETPNFKAAGNIYPSRFVEVATVQTTAEDFRVEECVTATNAALMGLIGISDETGRDARHDVNDTRAAADGDVIKIYGEGSSPVMLEMAATCTRGQLLRPNVATDGKGVPVTTTSGAGIQTYGAKALEACTASGQKIHVQVMFGYYSPLAT
jgi:hypothetical protein